MKFIIKNILFFVFIAFGKCYADIAAPLGLVWGLKSDVIEKDYSATLVDEFDGRGKIFLIDNPPIKIEDFNEVYAAVDSKYGLYKVILFKNINNDAFGNAGKSSFDNYEKVLTEKYGKPKDLLKVIGKSLYTQSDEFYQCLNYQGCGAYSAFYSPINGGGVLMKLDGKSRGNGALNITYESAVYEKIASEQKAKENGKIKQGL
ncbi:hypothetical protein [Enterobacter sp. ENT03]|uniref:hypothetical protein n=1 Tax=Enterobacter sp. ENT03 TaxID=2854780 RepID=UPI001C44A9E8|nr:hypothetical protein [Enterobacter sp. ENT03]MBV7404388.1 hypothetical protein [Enterobacter sp. ENT03]